jgi:hypothetical protein
MARFITRTVARLISSPINPQNNTPNQIRSAFSNNQHRQLIRLNSNSAATTQTKPSIDQTNHVVGRSGKVYSHRTVKIVGAIGRLLGYTLQKSTAVTLTSDYYDRCAARFEIEKQFWVEGEDIGLDKSKKKKIVTNFVTCHLPSKNADYPIHSRRGSKSPSYTCG